MGNFKLHFSDLVMKKVNKLRYNVLNHIVYNIKMSGKTYYKKNTTPDLYELFGLTIEDGKLPGFDGMLETAYQNKIRLCHVDLFPEEEKPMKQKEMMMLNLAFSVLSNNTQREQYNNERNLMSNEGDDFMQMKLNADKRQEFLQPYTPPTQEQISAFDKQMGDLNKKHGYNASLEGTITVEESKRRLQDLKAERDNIYKEVEQPQLFQGAMTPSDMAKFNEAFDKYHSSHNATAIISEDQWGDYQGEMSNYGNSDDYGFLYNDTPVEGNEYFASPFTTMNVNNGVKLTAEEVAKMQGSASYAGHNLKDEAYYAKIKANLQERKKDTDVFNNRKFNDYKPGQFDQFSIFNKIDPKMSFTDRLGFTDEETLEDRFSKINTSGNNNLPSAESFQDNKWGTQSGTSSSNSMNSSNVKVPEIETHKKQIQPRPNVMRGKQNTQNGFSEKSTAR